MNCQEGFFNCILNLPDNIEKFCEKAKIVFLKSFVVAINILKYPFVCFGISFFAILIFVVIPMVLSFFVSSIISALLMINKNIYNDQKPCMNILIYRYVFKCHFLTMVLELSTWNMLWTIFVPPLVICCICTFTFFDEIKLFWKYIIPKLFNRKPQPEYQPIPE